MRMIMLICGSVLLLTCAAFFVYEYLNYHEIVRREISTIGKITADNITSSVAFHRKDDAAEILQALKAQKNIEAAALYDKEGKLFASYPTTLTAKDFPSSPKSSGYSFRGNRIEGFEPVVQKDARLGTLYLRADMKGMYDRISLYGFIGVAVIGISFLFAFLLSRRLQGTISNPILQLAKKARIVSEKRDYSIRAKKKSNDELGELTDAFNHMLTQIEAQNAEIKQLNANLEEKIAIRTYELQEANTALRDQNEFIETIIDSSVDLIAVFDRDYRFVIVNKKADHVYNIKKEDLVGRKVEEVFPNIRNSSFLDHLQRAFTGEFLHQDDYKSVASDTYFENFYIPLRDQDDTIDRVLVIGHDITTIMQATEKLREVNTELEKSNRDLEQFAYVASHDLQEPLRKIKTFSELGEQNIQHPEILKRYLQKINSSAGRMTDLIKAVLNYSRLNRDHSEFVSIDLNEIIRHIETDLELLIQEKKATIEADQLPAIKGITLQMNQLFLNLFTNSLKFSDKPPHIIIKAVIEKAEVPDNEVLKTEQPFVKIIFSDNGIGFEEEYADKVFAIFQRLHSTDKYAGTGIGLALCKKIVENHDGFIRVESRPGEGSTFFIYLPYDPLLQTMKTELKQAGSVS
jgi:PAS domain S-box-containing protein